MPRINPYYGEDASGRPGRVRTLFDRIAPCYNRVNDVQSLGLHRLLKRRLIRTAALRHDEHALDLCCGTGDIALGLAAGGGEVTGLDFSPGMLEVARRRDRRGRVREFLAGDALRLPFEAETFHVITIAFGLRNLVDIPTALDGMKRVLRPGGRLLILEFGKPASRTLRRLWYLWLRLAMPLCGLLLARDAAAYRYILASLEDYPAPQGIRDLLAARGFSPIRVTGHLGGMVSLHHAVKAGDGRDACPTGNRTDPGRPERHRPCGRRDQGEPE